MTEQATPRQARKTTFIVGGAFVLFGVWSVYRGRERAALAFACAALALLLVGAVAPRAAMLFHRGWMRLAFALSYVNTRLLLSLMYWLAIAPIGLVMRMAGRDALLRRGRSASTYWVPRTVTRQRIEGFERTF